MTHFSVPAVAIHALDATRGSFLARIVEFGGLLATHRQKCPTGNRGYEYDLHLSKAAL